LLLKRRGIFYFRWQIPTELRPILGRRELIKSLRTRDKALAECRAAPLRLLVHRIKLQRTRSEVNDLSPEEELFFEQWNRADEDYLNASSLEPLTEDNSKEALAKLWELALSESKQITDLQLDNLHQLKAYQRKLTSNLEDYREILFTQMGSFQADRPGSLREFISDCRRDLAAVGYRLVSGGAWAEQFVKDYVQTQAAMAKYQQELLAERERQFFSFPVALVPQAAQKSDDPSAATPRFSEVYEQFLASKLKKKPPLSKKEQSNYRRYLSDWNELMEDKPVGLYTRKEIKKQLFEKLLELPKRNSRPYNNRRIAELLELDDIPDESMVAPKTVGQLKRWIQGVFRFAIDEFIIDQSPVRDLGLNLESDNPYGNFKDEEVRRMLDFVAGFDDWRKWVFSIAAYTGMRRTEIVQLRREDLYLDSASQRYYFLVTDRGPEQTIKTANARRRVPIHRQLLEMGLVEYCRQTDDHDRIFPDLKPRKISDWYSSTLAKQCDVPDVNEFELRLRVHSFRATVVTKLRGRNINTAIVQQIIGHKITDAGITDNYTHDFQVADLVEAMDTLRF
jgi:integrase